MFSTQSLEKTTWIASMMPDIHNRGTCMHSWEHTSTLFATAALHMCHATPANGPSRMTQAALVPAGITSSHHAAATL
jgi:hypothetical protein